MILTSTPDPEQVLADLRDVTDAIWESLEAGILHAREYFDSRGQEPDAFLAAHLTRYEAKRRLEQQQHEAEFERRELSNSGLRVCAFRNGRVYDLRIRRSDDGNMPAPQSDAMEDFYYQPVLEGIDFLRSIQAMNLVILWETPRNYSHITSLAVACPRAAGQGRAEVEAHFHVPIPHPATTTQMPIDIQEQLAEEEPITDLAIERLPQEQTGTGDHNDDEG
jgi:hypothetical protein